MMLQSPLEGLHNGCCVGVCVVGGFHGGVVREGGVCEWCYGGKLKVMGSESEESDRC